MKPYQGILALIGYFLLQIVIAPSISKDYYAVISSIIAIIAFGWLLHKKQMLPLSSRDLKGSQLFFCLGIGLGVALFFKIEILFGFLKGEPIPEQAFPDPFSFAGLLATSVVLIPVVEELLFRGILFGSFCRSTSYQAAIVYSAVLFVLSHLMISWLSIFFIGILLAWLYWRTDNLAVTMVVHGTINLGSLLSTPLYILLTTHPTIGVMVCLLVVILGIGITYLSTKMFLKKHDALPT